MDTTYARTVALAAPVFLAAVTLEMVVNRVRGTRYYRLDDALTSVGCGIAFTGVRVLYGFTGLLAYDVVLSRLAPVSLPAGDWRTWVFAFVVYDFCYYWWHRLSHQVGFLWAVHVVHHQSEEFNLTTALRQPATGFLSGWIFYLPLALCGVPMSVYLVTGLVQLFYQFWPHTRHIGRLGALDRWVQTPSNHRVHHARNDRYINKNYVGVFLIWDRLFGTFEEERDEVPCEYGITDPVETWNPVWANLHFYWSLARVSWLARSWKDKVRVWFGPPGWLPADVTHFWTPPAPSAGSRSGWESAYALVQFGAVIAANEHFLLTFGNQSVTANALYFAFVAGSLVTISAVVAQRSEFFPVEMVRLALVAALAVATGRWFGGIAEPAGVAAVAAFALASLIWFVFLWGARAKRSTGARLGQRSPAEVGRRAGG
jgi:sterol desaturase/sphingolipid hydroxylase (fatty acid hydroxylase superfamily)